MKKPIDPNDIKEILSRIPDDLEPEETPKIQIDVRVFQQILAPMKKYLESQQSSDRNVSGAEAIDKLADYVEQTIPHMKSGEKQAHRISLAKSKRTNCRGRSEIKEVARLLAV